MHRVLTYWEHYLFFYWEWLTGLAVVVLISWAVLRVAPSIRLVPHIAAGAMGAFVGIVIMVGSLGLLAASAIEDANELDRQEQGYEKGPRTGLAAISNAVLAQLLILPVGGGGGFILGVVVGATFRRRLQAVPRANGRLSGSKPDSKETRHD